MGDISIKGHSPILRQGFAKGGRAGFKHGTKPDWKKGKFGKKTIAAMKKHDFPAGGPHQSLEGKKAALRHASIRAHEHKHGRDSKAEGGRIGLKKGEKVSEKSTHSRIPGYKPHPHGTHSPGNIKALRKAWGRTQDKKPHSTAEGRHATSSRKFGRVLKEAAGMKKGGKADKNWIQKATASIKRRKTKGKCTPITKPGCTGRAKALAKTFKKMAKKRKAA